MADGAGRASNAHAGSRLRVTPVRPAQFQKAEVGSCEFLAGLSGDEQLQHHRPLLHRALGLRGGLFMPTRAAHTGPATRARPRFSDHTGASVPGAAVSLLLLCTVISKGLECEFRALCGAPPPTTSRRHALHGCPLPFERQSLVSIVSRCRAPPRLLKCSFVRLPGLLAV